MFRLRKWAAEPIRPLRFPDALLLVIFCGTGVVLIDRLVTRAGAESFYFPLVVLSVTSILWTIRWLTLEPRSQKPYYRTRPRWCVVVVYGALTGLVGYAGVKAPIIRYHLAQFASTLRDGTLLDASGKLSEAVKVAAVANLAEQLVAVTQAAVDAVEVAQGEFDAVEHLLSEFSGSIAYLAGDFPRALPNVWTNHNITATIEHLARDGTHITAYVWYTLAPTIVPRVALEYSVRPNQWDWMVPVTNSFPEVFEVNGVPCVKHEFIIPPLMAGIPMRPNYELEFGTPYEPLQIPLGGVVVTDSDGHTHHGFTGTDQYTPDFSVTYDGGIAVSAMLHGTNYTGVVNL